MTDVPTVSPKLDIVANAFGASASIFASMGASLYSVLCGPCADDIEVLALAAHAPDGARPTALFSAVHYLLLADPSDPLARYFATLTDEPLSPAGAYREFARFARTHHGEIKHLLETRTVQTTYAERCRAILPPMVEVARLAGQPLNLIEIGCSAGVLLTFDKYAYRMSDQGLVGDAQSTVQLAGTLNGGPELFIPRIGRRIGIDLHTMDVSLPEERRWLLALCFPELREEQRRLAAALDIVAASAIDLLEGDGLARLPEAFAMVDGPLCVFHSACLFYWPSAARIALEELFLELSRGRDFWRIAIEPSSEFDDWQKGKERSATGSLPADKSIGKITIFHYRDGDRNLREVAHISPDYGTISF